MTKLHLISTKVIPIYTFVNAFANFNPRIHILSFLDSAQAGVLKTAQNLFLKCLGNKSVHQITWNLITDHFKFGILTAFLSIALPTLILE